MQALERVRFRVIEPTVHTLSVSTIHKTTVPYCSNSWADFAGAAPPFALHATEIATCSRLTDTDRMASVI